MSSSMALSFNKPLAKCPWRIANLLEVNLDLQLFQHLLVAGYFDILIRISRGVYDWKQAPLFIHLSL